MTYIATFQTGSFLAFCGCISQFSAGFLAGKTSVHSFQRVLFQTAATMTRQLEGVGGEYCPQNLYLEDHPI